MDVGSGKGKSQADKEKVLPNVSAAQVRLASKYVPNEVGERYKFSSYLLSPNKFRFSTVVRILTLVFLFIQKVNVKNKPFNFLAKTTAFQSRAKVAEKITFLICHAKLKTLKIDKVAVMKLPEDTLTNAWNYYFKKATSEVLHFVDPKKYKNKSELKDGILYFPGRILSTQETNGKLNLGDACLGI